MIEILARFNVGSIILRNIKNEAGIGGELLSRLNKDGITVEYFSATPTTHEQSTIIMIVTKEDIYKAMSSVNNSGKKIGGEDPEINTDIMEITIRGVSIRKSSDPLVKAFSTCGEKNVNVIAVHTTPISIHIYIATKDFSTNLIDELQKEYKS